MPGLTQKYRHTAGFDQAIVTSGAAPTVLGAQKILDKFSRGVHPMSQPNCLALIRRLGADARVTDIRYIAYMLATATKEARVLREYSPPVPPTPKGKAATSKPVKPKMLWVIYDPINENWKGLTLNYLEPVKVAQIPEGALITEVDGDQFWVNPSGTPLKGRAPSYAPGSNRSTGATYGGAHHKIYADAPGVEVHFRGRGLVQLTWWFNYAEVSAKLGRGLDLLFNPDLALQQDIAYEIMVRGMLEGWFTGKSCGQYFTDSATDYFDARNIINPRDKGHRQEIADIALAFEALLMSARTGAVAAKN